VNRAVALLAAPAVLVMAGCIPPPAPEEAQAPAPVAGPTTNCPVLASRKWTAWLEPAGKGRKLTISGEVDLPTSGFNAILEEGPADRMMPPSQRFTLVLTPPGGMTAQVVTPTMVRYEGKATYSAYRSILIRCGDTVLATITQVPSSR